MKNLDRNATFFPFSSATDTHPALEGFIRFWTFIILYQVSGGGQLFSIDQLIHALSDSRCSFEHEHAILVKVGNCTIYM